MKLINNSKMYNGIYRALLIDYDGELRIYAPGICSLNLDLSDLEKYKYTLPAPIWNAPNLEAQKHETPTHPCWVTFENGDSRKPIIMGWLGDGIMYSAGEISKSVTSTPTNDDTTYSTGGSSKPVTSTPTNDEPIDNNSVILTDMFTDSEFSTTDIMQIPFLSEQQIETVLTDSYFSQYSNSRLCVSNPEELAKQLYDVQTSTGLSVLVSMAIAANETGWCRYFAGSYYNMWNFGANSSQGEFGHYFDNAGGIAAAFEIFHKEFLRQYYIEGNSTVKSRGGPWKTLNEMEKTYCPSPPGWSTTIGKCAVMIAKFIITE